MSQNSNFIIVGPDIPDGEQFYWNNQFGWIENFNEATTFDQEIMFAPLPMGGVGYLEVSVDGCELIGFWRGTPLYGVSENNF